MLVLTFIFLGIIDLLVFFGFFEDLAGIVKEPQPEKRPTEDLVGRCGIVKEELRPSGRISDDGKSFDAVSNHAFLERGCAVTVVEQDDIRLMVKRKDGVSS